MNEIKNVLFITADQWRGDCLSALGHPCLRTPHLDRLASDGVLFRRHYAQATPCGPGRASLYTGLYLHNHRSVINGTPLDARHSNFALEARKAGYEPVLFGYTDISPDPRQFPPGDPALTTYEGVLSGLLPVVHLRDDQKPWLADLKAKGYQIPAGANDEVFRPSEGVVETVVRGSTFAPARYAAEDSNTAFLTNEVIKYISVRAERPWIVHLSYLAPHPPFIVPAPYHELYDPGEVPPPVRAARIEDEAAQHPWLAYYLFNQHGTGATVGQNSADNIHFSEAELRQVRATYYGMMSEVDHQIGRLIAGLNESGQYENTLIIFTSDHGEQLGDHWLFAKYGYFDQAFHIPLILRDPRRDGDSARGRQVEVFTENVDVMPTLLDWLGLEVPPACDGESLLAFCRGETPAPWREEAHWSYDFRSVVNQKAERALGLTSDQCVLTAVRGERYKYVHFAALPPLFFDLQEDPWEFRNLAGDPAYRDLVLDYAQRMLSWRLLYEERALTHIELTENGPFERKGSRR